MDCLSSPCCNQLWTISIWRLPTKLSPEKGTPEYDELMANPDKAYLKTVTSQFLAVLGISLVEILSKHSSDEVYLGQRDTPDWTSDAEPLQAFEKFGKKLADIEERILRMNSDEKFRNRYGPVKMPYTLLYPTSKGGLTGMGFPTVSQFNLKGL
ncbi:putative linoleate 9S-lipoxygenase 5 [Glycine soja]|uniref:Putative linoleate 9S-lipoxygenase 5 n=1 Tax=Glycine soja TaxID=3848 RepID=A0A445F9J0_GLYSO|nr:Putative linoleate 9S-lipoxygenase 5 [Glycine soja]RZB45439.1 putative linoleate 9S-lipoxygenase 5 [Glycine soja]